MITLTPNPCAQCGRSPSAGYTRAEFLGFSLQCACRPTVIARARQLHRCVTTWNTINPIPITSPAPQHVPA